MISEILIHRMGFSTIWYAHPGPYWYDWQTFPKKIRSAIRWLLDTRWHVGIWTGPNGIDFCVKPCSTHEEAEEYLSPGARTIFGAAIGAWLKRKRKATP